MAQYIDLHMHTEHSDGVLTAESLLKRVRKGSLSAFAVTDHDTIDGYLAVSEMLTDGDPELIPGAELSVDGHNQDMHLLAYFFDPNDVELREALDYYREARRDRAEKILEKLQEMGIELDFSVVEEVAHGAPLGRPHIAQAMLNAGTIRYFEEAFDTYIGNEKPAYVPKAKVSPGDAIALVHRAGGVVVLAHPFIGNMIDQLQDLLSVGLDGLETYHYSHSRQQTRELKRLARKHDLIMTGGSDFHGRSQREGDVGSQGVPANLLESMRIRVQQIRGAA